MDINSLLRIYKHVSKLTKILFYQESFIVL